MRAKIKIIWIIIITTQLTKIIFFCVIILNLNMKKDQGIIYIFIGYNLWFTKCLKKNSFKYKVKYLKNSFYFNQGVSIKNGEKNNNFLLGMI